MYDVVEIGNVEERHDETEFEWKINDFFSVTENRSVIKCPSFSFVDTSWYLLMFSRFTPGVVNLYLVKPANLECSVEYYYGLKKHDGSIEHLTKGILPVGYDSFEDIGSISRFTGRLSFELSEAQQRRSELAPSDVVTVTCTLKRVATHTQRANLLKPPKFQKFMEEESLYQVYKQVFLEGQNHDLILKTEDKEFPVHRDILRFRSRVFESMLSHDMKEKNSGIIDVPDCDPNALKEFLMYVYCGRVEIMDENNMFGLYYIADKYDMGTLKEECCEFIKKSMSPTNASQVIQLALNHSDPDLLECATEYFCSNSHNILPTEEWQSFLKDNSTVANELLIKTINALRNSKN